MRGGECTSTTPCFPHDDDRVTIFGRYLQHASSVLEVPLCLTKLHSLDLAVCNMENITFDSDSMLVVLGRYVYPCVISLKRSNSSLADLKNAGFVSIMLNQLALFARQGRLRVMYCLWGITDTVLLLLDEVAKEDVSLCLLMCRLLALSGGSPVQVAAGDRTLRLQVRR